MTYVSLPDMSIRICEKVGQRIITPRTISRCEANTPRALHNKNPYHSNPPIQILLDWTTVSLVRGPRRIFRQSVDKNSILAWLDSYTHGSAGWGRIFGVISVLGRDQQTGVWLKVRMSRISGSRFRKYTISLVEFVLSAHRWRGPIPLGS